MKKRICANCGSEVKEDSKFCTNCGTEYNEEVEIEKVPKRGKIKKDEIENVEEQPPVDVEQIKRELRSEFQQEFQKIKTDEEKEHKAEEIDLATFKSKLRVYPILSCFITLLLCLIAFAFFYNYYMKNLVIETTRTEKEVTVNDKGISDAVEKIYDATVVVESYVSGKLYATGSGFVYKTEGDYAYILTNDHVINRATEVKVLFSNNKKSVVKVIGSDSYSDIGLLRVEKKDVVAVAEIGSSEALKVGDTAFAVGAPLDSSTYGWTVTRGIISGKNRTVESSYQVMEVLQTDAAINSGNSGGPLCNSNGEVIGITNMKLASSSIEGMGFAIPIETAIATAEKLNDDGEVTYPYLGVALRDKETDDGEISVIVEEVEKKSPAAKGGIKAGDVITKIEGKKVTSSSFLKYNLYKYNVGDKVKITVERDGKEKVLEITLASTNEMA